MFLKYEQKIFKLLNTFFLWLLLTHKCSYAENCEEKYEKKILVAVCHGDLEEFPSNLDPKIEGLYLNRVNFRSIGDNAFEDLPNIKYLFLEKNPGLIISPRALKPLKKLHTLDLSFDHDINISAIEVPESLKQLKLTGMDTIKKSVELPISHLQELESLTLDKCNLDYIPSFGGPLINLKKLDLRKNNLKNLTLESLANLCGLKELYISSDASIQDYCECLRLNEWVKENGISGSNVTCVSSESGQTCNTLLSETFKQTFESCKQERNLRISSNLFSTVCKILLGCFVCVVLLIELYIICNRKDFSDDIIRAYFLCQKK